MDHDDDRLRRRLAALPDPPLPEALWARVAGARRRQVARRRVALGGGVAVAVAALALPFGLPRPEAADRVPSRAAVAADADAQLRILDRELQAAYRRGSDAAAIAQLWEARDALLREQGRATPVRPVRI